VQELKIGMAAAIPFSYCAPSVRYDYLSNTHLFAGFQITCNNFRGLKKCVVSI
jgi:hypothetical protein